MFHLLILIIKLNFIKLFYNAFISSKVCDKKLSAKLNSFG